MKIPHNEMATKIRNNLREQLSISNRKEMIQNVCINYTKKKTNEFENKQQTTTPNFDAEFFTSLPGYFSINT